MGENERAVEIKKLEERRDKINAKIQKVKALHNKEKRKIKIRRQILIGSCILWHVEQGKISKESILSMLDTYLEKPKDRSLFDL